jgi:long-chain acyl-CoA synthetase
MMDKVEGLGRSSRLKKLVVCSFPASLPLIKRVLFNIFKRGDLAAPAYGGRVMRFNDLTANGGKPAPVAIDMHKDVAVLQYTGGTTGEPKAAMLTHRNISSNVQQARMWFSAAKDGQESTLGVIPFFHVFAMTAVMNLSVMAGFKIIATPRFELKDTLKIINKQKPSFFPAVPAIYNAINNTDHAGNLSSLKFCVSGGAPLPLEVKQAFEKKTGGRLVEGYGLTESSPIACVNPVEGLNKPRSIGLPMPGTVVQIRDPETHQPLPQGERGELCIQGPQVMKGYWKNEEATKKTLTEGFLRTGDIATMDDEGYFFIVDRLKDMIITNGYKVYPGNVEKVIYANPKVEECIVAGIPDANRGEIVKAWVKPKNGQTITADEIREFVKDKLSPMEVPRQVEIRDQPLPKTMIGKLSRKDILAEEAQKKGGAPPAAPAPGGPG